MGTKIIPPHLFREGSYTENDLNAFIKSHKEVAIIDNYADLLAELYEITHPNTTLSKEFEKECKSFVSQNATRTAGSWVYFPWRTTIFHVLNEDEFKLVRTNRNRELITQAEQKKFAGYTVGIIGLSIGRSIVETIAQMGGSHSVSIADFDTYSLSNANRVPLRLDEISLSKTEATAHSLWESNPYLDVQCYPEGVTSQNLSTFCISGGLNCLIDACDDFELKVRMRIEAKQREIPVIMMTNLGDSVLIDVERYDLDSSYPVFHGALDATVEDILSTSLTEEKKKEYAVKIVEAKHVPSRALRSLGFMHKELVGRPQLYSSVIVAGGMAAYVVRRMALNKNMPSGRYRLVFSDIFSQSPLDDE